MSNKLEQTSALTNQFQKTIAITATFTAEPVEGSLRFWARELEIPFRIQFAPYNQVFQQLLDSSSLISKNVNGMNVILLRFEDWIRNDNKSSSTSFPEEKEHLLGNRLRFILPNQLEIAHLNQYETDYMYKEIFVDQCYLKHAINIKDGDCIFDVGANIGLFTLFVQHKCRNTRIYAFEPSPPIFELLKVNTTLYGSDVKVFNCGLSSERKEAPFTFYEKSSVFSSFNPNAEQDKKSIKTVVLNMLQQNSTSDTGPLDGFVDELVQGRLESKSFICTLKTLSDVIRENEIQRIDLLKIDAERSELDILKGVEDGDWDKIKQIVMEVHDQEGGVIEEIRILLQEKGFKLVVDEEDLLRDSGLHTIFATRPLVSEESSKQSFLTTRNEQTIRENVKSLVAALKSAAERSSTPYLVCICPASSAGVVDVDQGELYKEMEGFLESEIDGISNAYIVKPSELINTYSVSTYYDPYSDELGHVPFTPDFFAALGTIIARKFHAIQSSPYKVIALDCDQTLWKGVCGEDGPLGIEIDPPRKKLQEFMVRQLNAGMLICLCSKNNEEDVTQVFDYHPEMPLKRDHIVSWRINWRPKSENLNSLANELQLGLDSFILIDDNPVECAEVQANCPEVLTIQLPNEPGNIPRFLDHIWAFDQLKVTEEDKKRTTLYQQNQKRERFQQESFTLEDFLAGLELEVKISRAMPHHFARVAQLTQRTNQFNFTTVRRSEAEIERLCQAERLECLVVEVSDRFGDYGLVGVILFETNSETIKADTFLLSCRALGRGVEHRMLARLGEIASERKLDYVEITYIPSKKNQPALDFLDGIGLKYKRPLDKEFLFRFPAEYARRIAYLPSLEKTMPTGDLANKKASSYLISKEETTHKRPKSEHFSRIATNLYSAEEILKAIESQHRKRRPDLSNEYVAPGNELERYIAETWQKVLGIEKVGIHDNFFEVGGTSLKGVQLIAKLRRKLNIDIPVVSLFESSNVSSMARMLRHQEDQAAANDYTLSSRRRGEKRRARRMLQKRNKNL